ncbi:ABC transporter permease [Nitratidesulfovibrio sp. D1]|uniref:ABC transporter permease n=1 Tax=Nitratidesulfovibrio sp. D1 TaxID=3440151 RepID=UPI003EBFA262
MAQQRIFASATQQQEPTRWLDVFGLLFVAGVLGLGIWFALAHRQATSGPDISLAPAMLPRYAAYSVGRMFLAYLLSMVFSLGYGTLAARSRRAGPVLLAVLDILQSVPILSFLPVVLLSLSALLPQAVAVEAASVVLIFTSQAWNITFAWYQAQTTLPGDLREAVAGYRMGAWQRFRTLDLPFAGVSLLWNSIMSWAGGWFFLMAAEMFTVGSRDFRLPGLGSYLQEAAAREDTTAILMGLGTMMVVIVTLDQLVWRPLLAWGERFKLTMVAEEGQPESWFLDLLRAAGRMAPVRTVLDRGLAPAAEAVDAWLIRRFPPSGESMDAVRNEPWAGRLFAALLFGCVAFGLWKGSGLLVQVSPESWRGMAIGIAATFLRVMAAMAVALAWTLPVGVLIGTNARLARVLQPVVQIAASIPATALFPVFLMVLVDVTHGLNAAAVLLMLLGTQWYLLFNIIAGASSIPRDLKDTAALIGLSRAQRWRTLILPALFPYIVTGAITASGGAWNASIVSEYVSFGGRTLSATGIGAIIARATAEGDFPLLFAGTLSMIVTVVGFNRLVWRRLYRLAEERFRME